MNKIMSPNTDGSDYNVKRSQSKLQTVDVVEMTLMLKSIGFRLESIDYVSDEGRFSLPGSASEKEPVLKGDADTIFVDITCSKSKLVSRLSYKFNQDGAMAAVPTHCTCPRRESVADNSFWEIQSSGSFINQQRNKMRTNDNGIDNDTSSNLLPVLSNRSIVLTQVLSQVVLSQYKNDIELGGALVASADIKNIMKTFGIEPSALSKQLDADENQAATNPELLNLITPQTSHNVTPTETELLAEQLHPEMADFRGERNLALEDTVNTEAFTSPKEDLFTSSPNNHDDPNNNQLMFNERDAQIVQNLKQTKVLVDETLRLLKLNVTQNLSQNVSTLLANTPRLAAARSLAPSFPRKNPVKATNARGIVSTAVNRVKKTFQSTGAKSSLNSSTSSVDRLSVPKLAAARKPSAVAANQTIGASTALRKTSLGATSAANKSRLTTSIAARRSTGSSISNLSNPSPATAPGLRRQSSGLTKATGISKLAIPNNK